MLPTILSDNLCSLRENEDRFAFTLDLYIKENKIYDYKFINTVINVNKNLRYDTKEQEENKMYKELKSIIIKMNNKYKYIDKIKGQIFLENYKHCTPSIFQLQIFQKVRINHLYENNFVQTFHS